MKEALVILATVVAAAYLAAQAVLHVLQPIIVAFSSHTH
jgi:hypothetical protein